VIKEKQIKLLAKKKNNTNKLLNKVNRKLSVLKFITGQTSQKITITKAVCCVLSIGGILLSSFIPLWLAITKIFASLLANLGVKSCAYYFQIALESQATNLKETLANLQKEIESLENKDVCKSEKEEIKKINEKLNLLLGSIERNKSYKSVNTVVDLQKFECGTQTEIKASSTFGL